MDPLSQGVLGAAAPQSIAPREHLGIAGLLGFLAGMTDGSVHFISETLDKGTLNLLFTKSDGQPVRIP